MARQRIFGHGRHHKQSKQTVKEHISMPDYFTIRKRTQKRLIPESVRSENLIPVLAYKEEEKLFINNDKTIGFGFICSPLTGSSESIEMQVEALLNDDFPAESQMQINLVRSPDLTLTCAEIRYLREGMDHEVFRSFIDSRCDFLKKASNERLVIDSNNGLHDMGYFFDLQLIITVKIPISHNIPNDKEIADANILRGKVFTGLTDIKVAPYFMTSDDWLRIMNVILNRGPESSWQNASIKASNNEPLCSQVFDYHSDIEIGKDSFRVGNSYVKCLSPKRRPDEMFFGEALYHCGSFTGAVGGVRQHFMISVNIVFLDPEATRHKIERNRQYVVNQAEGKFSKLEPILKEKERDFNSLYDSINKGKKPLRLSYHVTIFGNSQKEVDSAAITARNFWRTNRFELMTDKFIQLPIFINCLPLCCSIDAIADLNRHKTITSKEATVMLPIFGEWKGTGTHHTNLISRNGQVMSLSLHDSESNMNAVIAAMSGTGKSFLANEIIASYLSEGAQVWAIDVGRSYENLCETLSGSFLHFGSSSKVGVNPFPIMQSLDGTEATSAPGLPPGTSDDGEEDAIVGLLEAMAAPNEKLSDFQVAALKKVLSEIWCEHYRNTTIDMIQKKLLEHHDVRVRDVGEQLFAFTTKGTYGRFFNGPNTLKLDADFTVLELEELKGRKHLQQVVLLQLIYQIQQEMFHGERNRKKIIIIDEAWDLLTQGDVAKFIEHGYRRFRKYGGSVMIITQSINDLYESPTGRAISENSATTILLGQKDETLSGLKRSGRLELSDFDYQQLSSLQTKKGVYSEAFIISEYGRGIGRLVVDDFQKLLYSTSPGDVNAIRAYRKQGLSVDKAVNAVLNDRRGNFGVSS